MKRRMLLLVQEYRYARRQGEPRSQAVLDALFYLILVMNKKMHVLVRK